MPNNPSDHLTEHEYSKVAEAFLVDQMPGLQNFKLAHLEDCFHCQIKVGALYEKIQHKQPLQAAYAR